MITVCCIPHIDASYEEESEIVLKIICVQVEVEQ